MAATTGASPKVSQLVGICALSRWYKCKLEEGGIVYEAYFRSVLEVASKMLKEGKKVKLWSGGDKPAPPTNNRESPLDGDAFRMCEMTVMAKHGPDSFVLAFHVFSDASQLAWSGGKLLDCGRGVSSISVRLHGCGSSETAHPTVTSMFLHTDFYCSLARRAALVSSSHHFIWFLTFGLPAHQLYPLRMLVLNVDTDEAVWVTVAYIPIVRKMKEPGADNRARKRRCGLLQRVLFLAFRSAIAASNTGAKVQWGERELTLFARILLYICDLPEEKAVLCLKGGKCAFPCSMCDVPVRFAGTVEALTSEDRVPLFTIRHQLEAAGHRRWQRDARRRVHLESTSSAHSEVPVLAAMGGLASPPFLMYKMVGFDALHVSCLVFACPVPLLILARRISALCASAQAGSPSDPVLAWASHSPLVVCSLPWLNLYTYRYWTWVSPACCLIA